MGQTLQIYASELAKFGWEDDTQSVLVAGADVSGIAHDDNVLDIDPMELVGRGVPEPSDVKKGSRWTFRDDEPIVIKGRGRFAFLEPAL